MVTRKKPLSGSKIINKYFMWIRLPLNLVFLGFSLMTLNVK